MAIRHILMTMLMVIAVASGASAQSYITRCLNASKSVDVSHPQALDARLEYKNASATAQDGTGGAQDDGRNNYVFRSGGYRVQVYTNNSKTAKSVAEHKESYIHEAFGDDYATYVIYDKPYWRLRVGDFRTLEEAEELAAKIIELPAFKDSKKEVRVVHDRINNE